MLYLPILQQASSKNSNLSELFPSVLSADGFKPDGDGGLSEALSKALNISVCGAESNEPAVGVGNKGGLLKIQSSTRLLKQTQPFLTILNIFCSR